MSGFDLTSALVQEYHFDIWHCACSDVTSTSPANIGYDKKVIVCLSLYVRFALTFEIVRRSYIVDALQTCMTQQHDHYSVNVVDR